MNKITTLEREEKERTNVNNFRKEYFDYIL